MSFIFKAYVLSSQRRLVAKANMSEVSDLLSGKGDNLTMFLFTDSIEVSILISFLCLAF